ncbi:FAD-dependent monooxygenase [Castellaniella sp. S9]|uniref:FAD-dependent monooxygenase n=1 Tax=Castellaniella sp. S9 TaxID=2993652 RepID=UPI0022B46A48|nr:FAD-dependent monooxygenase [Castellaniella sp. S9]
MKKESIIVCGTGIAGLACALGLAREGHSASLLGPRHEPPRQDPDTYHPRVYALSPASQALLQRLGAWRLMDAARITPVEAMEVYGDGGGALDLSAWQDARDTLAWIVESGEIERALQQLVHVIGVPWFEDGFEGLEALQAGVRIRTSGGKVMQAGLLVGADGARSRVREAAGIHHRYTPYGDMGVVAHLDAEIPHQGKALQWFTGDSVLALLPMPDTADGPQVSMVWSLPEGRAREFLALDAEARQAFLAGRLLAITGARLGRLRMRSQPHGFPLSLERTGMVGSAVALVGDAAHRVHPLAGQGLNLGLGDVEALIEILRAREPFRAVGEPRVLARYRRVRAEPVLAMGLVTDGLHRLFGAECTPVAWARNEGMRLVDRLPFIKRRLIRAAAGR